MWLDNPDAADLREKVTQAWRDFVESLATLLPTLPSGARLDLTLDPTASGTGDASYSVSASVTETGQLRALAVSNAALPEPYRMNRAAIADMIALGWSPPGVEPDSGDQFGLTVPVSEAARLATVVGRTMRDIYGAPHPAFLVYATRHADASVPCGPLGTARPAQEAAGGEGAPSEPDAADQDDAGDLREQVRAVIAAMQGTTPDQLPSDPDGDLGIRAGSAMVFVKVRENPPLVDVFSPLLTHITPSEKLYGKLSELTNRMPIGRLYCVDDTVWASVPVIGRDFQPSHLMLAVQVMVGLADELDDRLHGEFGGRRFFGEDDMPPRHVRSAGTGMYL